MNYAPEIQNKRAAFEYVFIDRFTAGMMLTGTEVKSVRQGKVNLADAFCFFRGNDLFVRNLHIGVYDHGTDANHEPLRIRKLLLRKKELNKLSAKMKEKGFTIVPVRMFFNERGLCKIEIALAKGKKSFDKRESIRERDTKRDVQRVMREANKR